MKVQELINQLQALPDKHMQILVSADSEGNYIHALYKIELCFAEDEGNDFWELVPDEDEFKNDKLT
jgi:hypothetical protein